MPFIRYRDRNILFVHIPRTGGTSVEHWLRELGPVGLFSYSLPAFTRVTPQHLRINDIDELLGETFFDHAFAIVRNPFDRIASEFRLRSKLAAGSVWQGAPRFATWLEATMETARSNPFHFDNHLRPQWEFVSERVRIFRFEDGLDSVVARVAAELGIPAPKTLSHKLATTPAEADIRFDIAETDRVIEMYRRDFERFGYSLEPPPPVHVS